MEKYLQGVPHQPEKSRNPAPGPAEGGIFDIKISGDGKHLFVDAQPAKNPPEDLPAFGADITIYHKYISRYGFYPERLQGWDDISLCDAWLFQEKSSIGHFGAFL
jgi:hypothetical protein